MARLLSVCELLGTTPSTIKFTTVSKNYSHSKSTIMRNTTLLRGCYRRVQVGRPRNAIAPKIHLRDSQSRLSTSLPQCFSTTSSTTTTTTTTSLPTLPHPLVPPAPLETMRPKSKSMQFALKLSLDYQQQLIYRAEALFQAATRQSQDARWYGPLQVPRTFRSRHAILTLHIWLLHKRLLLDTYDPTTALAVDEELFNILWDDTTCRIRAQPDVMELAVNKHLLQVQQYTFLHLTHYDHAYSMAEEGAQRLHELRQLVWHHVFVRDPALEHAYPLLDPIVQYIDTNVRNILLTWPDAYYRDSRVAWTDLPDNNGANNDSCTVHPDDVIPTPWCRSITRRGQVYYWNTETYESTFTRPVTTTTSESGSSSAAASVSAATTTTTTTA